MDLAAEIERWLGDEPVAAFSEAWPARLARWARRRRTLVGSGTAAGLVAIVSLSVATVLLSAANQREQTARTAADRAKLATQAERDEVARQRDRAKENFLLARNAVASILTAPALKRLRFLPQAEPVRRELLETALRFHEQFLRRAAGDPSVRDEAALAHFQAGDLDYELGRPEAAVRQFEQSIALLREIEPAPTAGGRVRTALARAYNNLSSVQAKMVQWAAAEQSLKQCIELSRAQAEGDQNSESARADLARHYHNLSQLQQSKKDFAAAEASILTSLRLGTDLLATSPKERAYILEQSKHHLVYGGVLQATNRLAAAEREMRRSIDIVEGLVRTDSADVDARQFVSAAKRELGRLLTKAGRPADGEPLLRSTLVDFRAAVRDFPYVASNLRNLAQSLRDWGDVLRATGNRADARAAFLEAAQADERAGTVEPTSAWNAIEAAGRLCDFGVALEADGDLSAAIVWYGKAAAMLEDARRREPANATGKRFLTFTYWNRARTLVNSGRDREAIADWRRAAEMADPAMKRATLVEWACCCFRLDDLPAATAQLKTALQGGIDAASRYRLAVAASSAAAMAHDPGRAEKYAAQAAGVLCAMRADPFLAHPETLGALATGSCFEPLRQRADFRAFLADLVTHPRPAK